VLSSAPLIAALNCSPTRCISSWTSTVKNTVLPDSFAPTSAISRLRTLPKCTGSWLWQAGQILVVLASPHRGQSAADIRPSAVNTGGSAPPNPVRSLSTSSISGLQRRPRLLVRPVHRNMISRSVNCS
jgi:hypothetical protein